jgi:hypothetical protein
MKEPPYTPEDNAFVEKLCNLFVAFRTKGQYSARRDNKPETVVDIDSPTTLDAVQSWARSLDAHQKAHGGQANMYVQAALLVCHIVKTKPIFFASGGRPLKTVAGECAEYFERRFAEINEHFAFIVALNLLGIEPDQVGDALRERIVDMLYESHLDPGHLALTFEMLYDSNESEIQTASFLQQALAQLQSRRRQKK